jgi:hypothetical protein
MADDTNLVSDQFSTDTIDVPVTGLVSPVSSTLESSMTEGSSSPIEQTVVQAAPQPAQSSRGAGGNSPSIEDLKLVSAAASGNSCKTLTEIVNQTKLDKNTVVACVDYLVKNGLLASSAGFFCSLDAVRTLQSQLIAFKNYNKSTPPAGGVA